MRLQKHTSRKVQEKEYAKYVVVIPSEAVERLGWKKGEELQDEIDGDRLVIYRKPSRDSVRHRR